MSGVYLVVRLDGAWWKCARAHDQTGLLKGELEPYLERKPFRLAHEHDAERGEEVIRFHVTERPKAMWAVQLGEIIHDLHSALDHAIWQLVIDAGNIPREHVTGFPIFSDKGKYLGRGLPMIEGVADGARTFIGEIQPYKATESGDDPSRMALAVLHDLWNIDKHRLLHLMTVAGETTQLGVRVDASLTEMRVGPRVLKDQTEVIRFRPVSGTPGKVHVEMNGTAQILLDESVPDWLGHTGVMDVIIKVGQEVQRTLKVLSGFAADREGSP